MVECNIDGMTSCQQLAFIWTQAVLGLLVVYTFLVMVGKCDLARLLRNKVFMESFGVSNFFLFALSATAFSLNFYLANCPDMECEL